jgi:NADH dehydrogenase
MKRICILGGGFGGLYTALELSQQEWRERPEITLVDRDRQFLFTPLLYELVTGEMEAWEIAPEFSTLLADTDVQFCQGAVAQVSVDNRSVELEDGTRLDYDYLVLALGGATAYGGVTGAADFALPFRELADAQRLKEALTQWESAGDRLTLAIVGAGASGVELACKLADRLGIGADIRLLDRGNELLRTFQPDSRTFAERALRDRGVTVQLDTQVLEVGSDFIRLRQHDTETCLPVTGVLWTAGTMVAPAIANLPLPKGDRQRILTTPTLQVLDRPEIFALGDLAEGKDAIGQVIPATAQAAFQQASYCAWNVWALAMSSVSGEPDRPLLPFRYWPLGEMLSLGTDSASLAGLGLALDGPLGYLARRLIYLVRLPTLQHQMRVGWHWVAKPVMDEMQRWLQPSPSER